MMDGRLGKHIRYENAQLYKILVENIDGKKKLFGRLRCSWEDNNNKYVKEMLYEDMDWIKLAQDMAQLGAFINTIINIQIP
jgi:hypothetical protein